MKLFFSPFSPYVRKIHVLLHELDKLDAVELETIATTAFNSHPDLVANNPLGKVPALVLDDGTTLFDSRVICAYLNDTFHGSVYPLDARRWDTAVLEAIGDGIMDCSVSMAYETRLRPESEQSPQWVEAQWAKVLRAIDALDSRWIAHLNGPLDMGHIAVACALGYLDLRHDARGWRQDHAALAAWFDALAMRASMQASQAPAS